MQRRSHGLGLLALGVCTLTSNVALGQTTAQGRFTLQLDGGLLVRMPQLFGPASELLADVNTPTQISPIQTISTGVETVFNVETVLLEKYIQNADPEIIAKLLSNKEVIDQEQDQFIGSQGDTSGLTQDELEQYRQNVDNALFNLLRQSVETGSITEEEAAQIIETANQAIPDAQSGFDLNAPAPPSGKTAELAKKLREQRFREQIELLQQQILQQSERERAEYLEQQKRLALLQQQAIDRMSESLKEIHRQSLQQRAREQAEQIAQAMEQANSPPPPHSQPDPTPEPPPPAWHAAYPFYSAGEVTTALPAWGAGYTASYSGKVVGSAGDGSSLAGTLYMQLDTLEQIITGGMSFDGSAGEVLLHSSFTGAPTFSAETNGTTGDGFFGGSVPIGQSGALTGSFYGPNAEEMGGNWSFDVLGGTRPGTASGSFAAGVEPSL